jgi:hypothetical protein
VSLEQIAQVGVIAANGHERITEPGEAFPGEAEGDRVAIDGEESAARSDRLQQRLRVAAGADRSIDDGRPDAG